MYRRQRASHRSRSSSGEASAAAGTDARAPTRAAPVAKLRRDRFVLDMMISEKRELPPLCMRRRVDGEAWDQAARASAALLTETRMAVISISLERSSHH